MMFGGVKQATLGREDQVFRERSSARDVQALARGQVDHDQVGAAGNAGARLRGEEQQAGGRRTCLAEGQGVDGIVEGELRCGATAIVEAHHRAAVGPAGTPQLAAGRKREIVDAIIAEMGERVRGRVEDLDAVTRGDEQQTAGRIHGERLRQALAVAPEHGIGDGIELQQRAATRGGPQLAVEVEGHRIHGLLELRDGIEHTAAELVEAVQLAAVESATHGHAAVRVDQDGERPDAGVTLLHAGTENLGLERRQHPVELRGPRRRASGNALLRRDEQRIGGSRVARRRGRADILRGAAELRQRTEVGLRAVARQ
jgi:hypothetical protein